MANPPLDMTRVFWEGMTVRLDKDEPALVYKDALKPTRMFAIRAASVDFSDLRKPVWLGVESLLDGRFGWAKAEVITRWIEMGWIEWL